MNRWRLVGAQLILDGLVDAMPDIRTNVEVLIECILADPYDPPGLEIHPLRGREAEGFLVAYLGEGWYLTYRPTVVQRPPLMGRNVEVHAFVRRTI